MKIWDVVFDDDWNGSCGERTVTVEASNINVAISKAISRKKKLDEHFYTMNRIIKIKLTTETD